MYDGRSVFIVVSWCDPECLEDAQGSEDATSGPSQELSVPWATNFCDLVTSDVARYLESYISKPPAYLLYNSLWKILNFGVSSCKDERIDEIFFMLYWNFVEWLEDHTDYAWLWAGYDLAFGKKAVKEICLRTPNVVGEALFVWKRRFGVS